MLNRRSFFEGPVKSLLAAALPAGLANNNNIVITNIGGYSLHDLYTWYESELQTRFFPAMEQYIVDPVYGGFMCDINIRTGVQHSDTKKTWNEGRGIWLYAYLFNHFGRDKKILAVARKSVEFIMARRPGSGFWHGAFSKTGAPLPGEGDIYCNLYLAEGLAEYARASGDESYRVLAKELLLDAMHAYDSTAYTFPVTYAPANAAAVVAPRVVGHWMVFLHAAHVFLGYGHDEAIRHLADRCIDAILHKHVNGNHGLLNEVLTHDFQVPDPAWSGFAYLATAIQALWMVMQEAVRRGDRSLFDEAGALFARHARAASDAVYGGFFRSLDAVDTNTFTLDKVLSLQEEVMNGCLLLIEYTGNAYALETFAKTYGYIRKYFFQPENIFMVESGNRSMTAWSETGVGNYHHPRHLVYTLDALKRLLKSGGRLSEFTV